nr:prepilin-type N-terminal cleavage/methylation domain-containing protein [Bacilli bacterium]
MNKKGFTLIELLAVILILAIIAMILSPIVSKIIESAREQSDRRSAERYVKAAQEFYVESQMDANKRAFLGSNIINQLELDNDNAGGSIVAYEDGTVEMAITINGRCFTKTTTQDTGEIEVSKDTSNCTVNSSSVAIKSISSGNDSVTIELDDPSVSVSSCKYGTTKSNLDRDCTVSGNNLVLSNTVPGTKYNYEIVFSDGSKRSGVIVANPGEVINPINGGGSAGGGTGYSGGGSGSGGSGSGGTSGGGVAAPTRTEVNGRTVYTGRMLSRADYKYFNVDTGTKCDIVDFTANNGNTTNAMTSGCLKFWAYMEDDLSYTMILDRNIEAGYNWADTTNNGSGPTAAYARLKELTANWQGTITPKNYVNVYAMSGTESAYRIAYETDGAHARFITTDEVARITGNNNFNPVTSSTGDWFYLDGGTSVSTGQTWQTQIATSSEASAYKWLFNYTYGCTDYGCAVATNGTFGYWTSDAVAGTTNDAWLVGYNGALNYRAGGGNVNSPYPYFNGNGNYAAGVNYTGGSRRWMGIRPVISVLKSAVD